ncbi:MAG: hypothetical protein JWP12_3546 [Bacteroidetes bacterium]|nr:hypothetical protein [Bacteroidota bacterium]
MQSLTWLFQVVNQKILLLNIALSAVASLYIRTG